jgi:hypothetical protein
MSQFPVTAFTRSYSSFSRFNHTMQVLSLHWLVAAET